MREQGKLLDYRQAIGQKLNRDIFSTSGVLLIPHSIILSLTHIQIMEKHRIALFEHDVSPIGPYREASADNEHLIGEAVLNSSQLFEEIRHTREVPIGELRRKVVPMVEEATNRMPLLQLLSSLRTKDDYTYRHNIAVSAIASLIGTWLSLPRPEQLQLTTAALLHDVGKMMIPSSILNKPGKLTTEEFDQMKKHTVYGYELLRQTVGINHQQALAALQHHERLDGSGYPFGLKQDQIAPFSRIIAVADVFHAMTSKRVYRDPLPFNEVLFQMERDIYGALDPAITRTFVDRMMNSLIGHTVKLTDGREGTVRMIHPHAPTRPLVQSGQEYIDLSQQRHVQIEQVL